MSEEARVSSVFPEVRSAGGAKIKVEALLLKSGIGGGTCTTTRARRAAVEGESKGAAQTLLRNAFV